jgi:hypothetical protein
MAEFCMAIHILKAPPPSHPFQKSTNLVAAFSKLDPWSEQRVFQKRTCLLDAVHVRGLYANVYGLLGGEIGNNVLGRLCHFTSTECVLDESAKGGDRGFCVDGAEIHV